MKTSPARILHLYVDCAKETTRYLRRHWLVIPYSIALLIAWAIALGAVANLLGGSLITAVLLGFLQAACLSLFYNWLSDIGANRSPDWLQFRYETFASVISIGFFLYLINLSVQALQGSGGELSVLITLFVNLAMVIWCNPAPEIIQHVQPDGMNGIMLCYEFMREHGVVWLIAIFLVVSPTLIVSGVSDLALTVSSMHPLFPLAALAAPWTALFSGLVGGFLGGKYLTWLIVTIIMTVFGVWIMLFRSVLFQRLSGRR